MQANFVLNSLSTAKFREIVLIAARLSGQYTKARIVQRNNQNSIFFIAHELRQIINIYFFKLKSV